MQRRITLLERLAAARTAAGRTVLEDRPAVMRSILRNIQNILNTRLGSAAAQMDLGIPSPHELLQDYPASLEKAVAAIRDCITTYEPRLRAVQVQYQRRDEGVLTLDFTVRAQLVGGDTRETVNFHSLLDSSGKVRCMV